MAIATSPNGRRGRPRSDEARRAIIEATFALVVAQGYAQVTMDAIAAAAGAGKQTIYRWWGSKPELVLDALEDWAERQINIAENETLPAFLSNAVRTGAALADGGSAIRRQAAWTAACAVDRAASRSPAALLGACRHCAASPRDAGIRDLWRGLVSAADGRAAGRRVHQEDDGVDARMIAPTRRRRAWDRRLRSPPAARRSRGPRRDRWSAPQRW